MKGANCTRRAWLRAIQTISVCCCGRGDRSRTGCDDTHYTEVREILLPSGLSYFSTLQAFSPLNPRQYGPFVPRFRYDGDIADTPAVEKWVVGIAHEDQPSGAVLR